MTSIDITNIHMELNGALVKYMVATEKTRTRQVITKPRCTRYKCPILCQTKYCQGKPYGKREMIEATTALQQNGKNAEQILCLIYTQLLYIPRTGFLHPIQ